MNFELGKAYPVLSRTPTLLRAWLEGLDESWIYSNEGPDTFSPFDVLGHLIQGERTDWAARTRIILEQGTSRTFEPWDRFAQYELSKGRSLSELLDEFETLRKENLNWLMSLNLTDEDLEKKGIHPSLGEVTLRNLLATWVVHDLTHLAQIGRVMGKQYREELGPWPAYFRILDF